MADLGKVLTVIPAPLPLKREALQLPATKLFTFMNRLGVEWTSVMPLVDVTKMERDSSFPILGKTKPYFCYSDCAKIILIVILGRRRTDTMILQKCVLCLFAGLGATAMALDIDSTYLGHTLSNSAI